MSKFTKKNQFIFRRFGAGNCSETSLEDFLYMWKVIGYYLGVKDNFNPVLKNISETKALLWEIGHQIIIPAMLDLDTISIHMAKCITQAYRLDYHLAVYSNCYSKYYLPIHLLGITINKYHR